MDALTEATAALRSAEQQLRSILVKAAEAGDYDHLSRIAEWAKMLGTTLSGQPLTEPVRIQPEAIPVPTSGNGVHPLPTAARERAPIAVTRKSKAGRRKNLRSSNTAKAEYPKFVREGESLVKIGWSKSEGKTYEHKASRGVLRSLVKSLLRIGSEGKRFTVEGLFPLKDASDRSDIPDYQAYLTLAWLRNLGLITQHGRQGYSLPNGAELERQIEQHWSCLKAR